MMVENCVTESPSKIAGDRAGDQFVDESARRDREDRGEQQETDAAIIHGETLAAARDGPRPGRVQLATQ